MKKHLFSVSGYLTVAAILILCSCFLSDGVRLGLDMCGNVLIPSLFPFMIFTAFLAGSPFVTAASELFKSVGKVLFKTGGEEVAVFLVSLLSGYPSGAAMLNAMTKAGRIDGLRAQNAVCYCCGAGPAFLVTAVGAGILHDIKCGVILLCSHIIGAIVTAVVFARFSRVEAVTEPVPKHRNSGGIVGAVSDATAAMICVCSFVLVFAALGTIPERLGFSDIAVCIISCILEVTNGCVRLSELTCFLPIYAAVCGFGGVSVILQCIALCRPCSVARFVLARLMNAVVSFLVCFVLILLFPPVVPTFGAQVAKTTANPAPLAIALILMCAVFSVSVYSEKR